MNDSKISVRYAKAIFNLAVEQNKLPEINNDIKQLYAVCQDPTFDEFLRSPILSISKKQEVLANLFANNISKEVNSLLQMLAKNRREAYLKIVALNFFELYRKKEGIKEVTLTTVSKVSDDFKQKLKQKLADAFNSKIELVEKNNEEIIGGFIIKMDDQQIDESVSTKLQTIKKELMASSF